MSNSMRRAQVLHVLNKLGIGLKHLTPGNIYYDVRLGKAYICLDYEWAEVAVNPTELEP